MSTLAEIEQAITRLTPDQLRELTAWLDEHQRLIASSEGVFQLYDEEERSCRSHVAEKSG